MTLSNSSCYSHNDLLPQEEFILESFSKCWEVILYVKDMSSKVSLTTSSFGGITNTILSMINDSYVTGTAPNTIINKFSETCTGFDLYLDPRDEWHNFCRKATICMELAHECCNTQIETMETNYTGRCPPTWDSLTCFAASPVSAWASAKCPESLQVHEHDVRKYCKASGKWGASSYDGCQDSIIDHFSRLALAGIVCKCITIAAVIPAGIIMLLFRTLRQQQRIRVHLCLLLASLMVAVSTLTFQVLGVYSKSQSADPTVLERNPILCGALHLFVRYSFMALFMWMFIEFFHLHRLLMHAFNVPKSLGCYYIAGFGFPLFMVTIYGSVKDSDKCYSTNSLYDYICFGPNAAVLLVNLVLLGRIVNVLVRQLAPHPNEPSSFRRALKAVVIMMPSLGIQYVLFMWNRPTGYDIKRTIHNLLEEILCSLHGALIALVFCYLNKEIQAHITLPVQRMMRRNTWQNEAVTQRSNTLTTQYLPDNGHSPKEGLENGRRRRSEKGAPTNGGFDETFIPLRAISSSQDSEGQAGGDQPMERPNSDDVEDDINGGVSGGDEESHLDPGGHRY